MREIFITAIFIIISLASSSSFWHFSKPTKKKAIRIPHFCLTLTLHTDNVMSVGLGCVWTSNKKNDFERKKRGILSLIAAIAYAKGFSSTRCFFRNKKREEKKSSPSQFTVFTHSYPRTQLNAQRWVRAAFSSLCVSKEEEKKNDFERKWGFSVTFFLFSSNSQHRKCAEREKGFFLCVIKSTSLAFTRSLLILLFGLIYRAVSLGTEWFSFLPFFYLRFMIAMLNFPRSKVE